MLVADAASINILMNEWMKLLKNKNLNLLTVTFKDVMDRKKFLGSSIAYNEEFKRDISYWKEIVDSNPLMPNLPIHITEDRDNRFLHLRYKLEKSQWDNIKKYSAKESLTPTALLLSIYGKVLQKYSFNKEFYLNVARVSRPLDWHEDIRNIVGEFTDSILIFIDEEEKDFLKFSSKIQKKMWDAMGHMKVSCVEIIRDINRKYKENRIFPYVFTSTLGYDFSDLEDIKILQRWASTPQVLIDCQVAEINGNLEVSWDIRTPSISNEMAYEIFDLYTNLIENVYKQSTNVLLEEKVLKNECKKTQKIYRDGFFIDTIDIEKEICKSDKIEKAKIHYSNITNKLHGIILPALNNVQDIDRNYSKIERLESHLNHYLKIEEIDLLQVDIFSKLNKLSLMIILRYFIEKYIFVDSKEYSINEIIKKIRCKEKYEFTLNRWIEALEKEEIISKGEKGYYAQKNIEDRILNLDNMIENLKDIAPKSILEYLNKCSEYFDKIFSGEISAQEVLFPKGDTEKAFDIYNSFALSNKINDCGLKSIICILDELEKQGCKDLKILELGAGTGSFSAHILPKLKNRNIEYHYSDISQFFLNCAKQKYSEYSNVKYKIFDINKDINESELEFHDYDIVVSSNVLHNIINGKKGFLRIKDLLKADGHVVTIDAVRESPLLLVSMAFLYIMEPEDERKETKSIFYNCNQYEKYFNYMNSKIIYEYPYKDSELETIDQKIYICKLNKERIRINKEEVNKICDSKLFSLARPDIIHIVSDEEEYKRYIKNIDKYINVAKSKKMDKIKILMKNTNQVLWKMKLRKYGKIY